MGYDAEKDWSLLDVTIVTGVTHQIRCHLAAAGHSIVGDGIYGGQQVNAESRAGRKGQWLHSWKASFAHPGSGEACEIVAPPPAGFWRMGE